MTGNTLTMNRKPKGTRQIVGLRGFYISRYGIVWTCWTRGTRRHPRRLTRKYRRVHPTLCNGYLVVALAGRRYFVHVLVALTYIGPRPRGKLCRHLDGNRGNPVWTNLAWGTSLENSQDMDEHGTRNPVCGERHPRAKLHDRVVKGFLEDYRLLLRDFITKRAKKLNVHPATLAQIVNRSSWLHVRVRREIVIDAA